MTLQKVSPEDYYEYTIVNDIARDEETLSELIANETQHAKKHGKKLPQERLREFLIAVIVDRLEHHLPNEVDFEKRLTRIIASAAR